MRPPAARPPLERAEVSPSRRLVASAALVLLAFAVRVWGLADHSLWLDEAQLLVRAQSGLPTVLLGRNPLDLAPPLYPLLLHLWTRLGEPDFLLRFPSVAASVLAVAVLARLRPWPVGPLAALLYAVAPTQLHYAQEATPYALVGLLASAALVAAQTVKVSKTVTASAVAPLVVLAVLSAYTYYGLAFLWLGLDLWLLISYLCSWVFKRGLPRPLHAPRSMLHVLLAHLAVALAGLPLAPLWQRQAQAGLEAWWGQYGSLEGWTGLRLFAQGALSHGLVFALLPFGQPPSWLVLALLGVSLLGARRLGWLAGSGWLAWALAYVAASLGRYPFEGRYLLFSAPAVYAALAVGLTPGGSETPRCAQSDSRIGPVSRGVGLSVALALVAILVSAWPGLGLSVPWAVRPPREEIRPLLAYLRQQRAPDDAVYVGYGAAPAVAHYQRLGQAPPDLVLAAGWPAGRVAFQAAQALAAGQGHTRLWIVVTHARPGEEEALAETLTRRGAWLRERVTAPGAALLLWDLAE